MCLADVAWLDGSDVVASPRQILRRQLARLAERGWTANAGTELEFMVFLRHLRGGLAQGLPRSAPGEPLQRRLLAARHRAGRAADPADPQQHGGGRDGRRGLQGRVQLRPARDQLPLRRRAAHRRRARRSTRTAPRRSPPERAWRSRFMAKFDEREGSSCHIHFSLADERGTAVRARAGRCSTSFLAGQLACLREMTLLLAPERQLLQALRGRRASRRRRSPGATTTARARCASSATGPSLRFENRAGGADLNPYLALSAMIAAGLHGVDAGLELEPRARGQRLRGRRAPARAADARATRASCSPRSDVAREAFGEEVVAHYLNAADVELAAFQSAVTDWERFRGFERL